MTKASWRLTWRDRTLLSLALIAGVCGIAAIAAAFVVVAGHFGIHRSLSPKLVAAALLASYPLSFLVVFLHVAMAAAADARLAGNRLGLGEALGSAHRRTVGIALWALIALGVGLLLRLIGAQLPDKLGFVVWPLDLLWVLATIFVVPLLALEKRNVRETLHDSLTLLREGWGEGLTGILVIGVVTLVMVVPAFLLILVGLATIVLASGGGLILVAVGLLGIVAVRALTGALQQVFAVELYRYVGSDDDVEVTVA